MNVAGARVLLTGASRGIGEAAAIELARQGARLVLVARSRPDLETVAAEARALGAEVHIVEVDVSKPERVVEMVKQAEKVLGGIDVLVNNAGLGLAGPVTDIAPDDFRYVFEVNVVAPLIATQAVLPGMRRRKKGRIVNVGSVASHISTVGLGGYSATKFALKAWSDALRMELGGTGIAVVLVCPGPIRTDFVANVRGRPGAYVPKAAFGAPAEAAGHAVVQAISGRSAEIFVPAYWQAAVGANSVAPQLLRIFGRDAQRRLSRAVDAVAGRRD